MKVNVFYDNNFVGVCYIDKNEVIDSLITVKRLLGLGHIQTAKCTDDKNLYITSK